MELKVSVDGILRVVCGVTEQTTCQEVVIALAQAQGRTGRYTLREKYKEYERNVTPDERLLESLGKYGEQFREVQLTLNHNGPSLGNESGVDTDGVRLRGGRYQSGGTHLRRAHLAAGHGRRGSEGKSLNRQSLPPLSRLRFNSEGAAEEHKKPKRKSLTLMEEAWGWLESLGRNGKQQLGHNDVTKVIDDNIDSTNRDRKGRRSYHTLNHSEVQVSANVPLPSGRNNRRGSSQLGAMPKVISCLGSHGSDEHVNEKKRSEPKALKNRKKESQGKLPFLGLDDLHSMANKEVEDEKEELRKLILNQLSSILDLRLQIDEADTQIRKLEEHQTVEQSLSKSIQVKMYLLEEEAEQLDFWENELKAEEGFERDLQLQFMELKEKAGECKTKLLEYQHKLEGLDVSSNLTNLFPERDVGQHYDNAGVTRQSHLTDSQVKHCVRKIELEQTKGAMHSSGDSQSIGKKSPHAFVGPVRASESRISERSQLREWWVRWSAGQGTPVAGTKPKRVHRSEITIQLNSTRV